MKYLYILFSPFFIFYLALPNPDFPAPPPDSIQSDEPADTETPLRRAYFTNFSREDVMVHYQKQFERSALLGIPLPTYRLNYPPEEARNIIRGQTRATFLEEIVHPFRESVYVNGFEPKDPKDAIFIQGQDWRQKIIIRFIPSAIYIRLLLGGLTLIFIPILYKEVRKVIAKYA